MSKATHTLQKAPNGQNPTISVAAFHGITKMATSRSEMAREMTKKFVTFDLKWRNLVTAAQTRVLPSNVVNIRRKRKHPVKTRLDESRSDSSCLPSRTVEKFCSMFLLWCLKNWGALDAEGGLMSPHHIPSKQGTEGLALWCHSWNSALLSGHLLSHRLPHPQAPCQSHHFCTRATINISERNAKKIYLLHRFLEQSCQKQTFYEESSFSGFAPYNKVALNF